MLFNRRKAEIEILSSLSIEDMSQSKTAETSFLGEIGNSGGPRANYFSRKIWWPAPIFRL